MKKNALGVPAVVAPTPVKAMLPIPSPASTGSPAPSAPPVADDLSRRVAEAKRRVAEAQSKLAIKDNPYMVCLVSFLFRCGLHLIILLAVNATDRQEESPCRTFAARCRPQNGGTSLVTRQHAYGPPI